MAKIWQRSASIPFPKVWTKFKGSVEINGKIPLFWIQDIPEDMYESVTEKLIELIIAKQTCKTCKAFLDDPVSVMELKDIWAIILKERMSLVCFTETDDGITEVASISLNSRRKQHDVLTRLKFRGKELEKLWFLRQRIFDKYNFYKEFNIEEVLTGMGGYTFPKYSEQNVSVEMLKCRELLCRATKIKMSLSLCVTDKAREDAERVGYEAYTFTESKDMASAGGGFNFRAADIKLMYISYEKSAQCGYSL